MNPAKRRRMDHAVSTLTKPFRSPLHVDPNKQKPSPEKQDDQSTQVTPTKDVSDKRLDDRSSPTKQSIPSPSPSRLHHQPHSSPIRPPLTREPEYIALQKQHSALLLQLKTLSSSLDTTNQALKIIQSHKDDELERLVAKWRAVSRDAAEELFATAKDRVNRMGGVGVWRDKFTRPREQDAWTQEPGVDEDDLTEEQKEQIEIARDEAQAEAEKYGLHEEQTTSPVEDDDSFTIDLMLKQLNIDLALIGYDVNEQRWVD